MPTPDCYSCKYRGKVPGSAHSQCMHGMARSTVNDDIDSVLLHLMGSRGMGGPVVNRMEALGIELDPYGVQSGWANWPYDFDPVWLQKCNGFQAIEV